MRDDADVMDRPHRPRFYDPDAPLDKALPEAISDHGLKLEIDLPSPSPEPRSLADRVLADLSIDDAVIAAALAAALRNETDIGRELVAAGVVGEERLADAIATAFGLPVEPILQEDRIVPDGGGHGGGSQAPRIRFIKTCDDRLRPKLFLAPRIEDLDATRRVLAKNAGRLPMVRIATPGAIARHRADASAARRSDAARLSLSGEWPEFSARNVLTGLQGMIVASLVIAAFVVAVLQPAFFFPLLHLAVIPLFFGAVLLRLCAVGMAKPPSFAEGGDPADSPEPHPVYSVLVALYRESDIVPDLVRALAELRWPRSKLEVMLICEGDDPQTIAAARAATADEPGFTVVVVPPSLPRTKPKALNFALPLATGEFVVLYDAEDRPRPDQLEVAWHAMREGGGQLACLQAPLVVQNAGRNWLTGHFALEYAALFRGFLPFLARMRLPLPLGGTSNHFRHSALIAVGGWDSHNVTEDADLGIRLHRRGYRVGTIDAPTFEDAPERWTDWRNQRSRWMKGWMQTYLVHMRHPLRLGRDLGPAGFAAFQLLFFGMIASTLAQPFFLAFLAYTAFSVFHFGMPDLLTRILVAVDLFNLVFGTLAFALLATRSLDRTEARVLPPRLWSLYGYWFLISIASARAFSQLVTDPHKWEKTPHGKAARAVGGRHGRAGGSCCEAPADAPSEP